MSAAFVRAPAVDIDREIDRWHKEIVLALNLDRSSIGQFDPETGTYHLLHQWGRPGTLEVPQDLSLREIAPWLTQKLMAGERIVYSNPVELSAEFAEDLKKAETLTPKSFVAIPLQVGGVTVGMVGFATLKAHRTWPAQLLRRLQVIAEIFGNALERKRAAESDARVRAELTHVSRAATMGELAAALAHELNQPLAAIMNNAEAVRSMLQSETPDIGEIKAAVDDIVADDARAGEIIKRLRSFFRHGELQKSTLDLAEVVGEIGRMVRSDALNRNVAFRFEARRPIPPVAGDRIQLQQAILNLILNAFEAVSDLEQGPRETAVQVLDGGSGRVRVLVRDSGEGIKPQALQRMFDPFFTTKPKGMGMGLVISRSIVEAHGGRLSASSNPDGGATFEIALPALSETAV